MLEQLAFAVKVQPARPIISTSRISAGDSRNTADTAARQTLSGKISTSRSEMADASEGAETNADRQARDAGADQAQAAVNGATGKGVDKKLPTQAAAQQNSATPNNSSNANALSLSSDLAGNTVGTSGKTSASSQGAPAVPGEAIVPDPLSAPTSPMKDIAMRVESAQGQTVDVRIVQRAGNLQIAVKSVDVDTTQGLRHGLSELTSRLNESGYHAESWRPGHPAAAAETAAGSGESSHQPPSGDSQSHSGWSQQNQGQRDNNPSNRPRWIQELESNLAGGTESTEQFHGLIS